MSGNFDATFSMTPLNLAVDGVIGISNGPATGFNDLRAAVRFDDSSGRIEAYDGSGYSADENVYYDANIEYDIWMRVDTNSETYDVYVKPQDGIGDKIMIADDYQFRAGSARNFTYFGYISEVGSLNFCSSRAAQGNAQACDVKGISWSTHHASRGEEVVLTAETQDCADGTVLDFVVYEADRRNAGKDDLYSGSDQPGVAVVNGGVATTTWTAEYRKDKEDGRGTENYFNVELDGKRIHRGSPPYLKVV